MTVHDAPSLGGVILIAEGDPYRLFVKPDTGSIVALGELGDGRLGLMGPLGPNSFGFRWGDDALRIHNTGSDYHVDRFPSPKDTIVIGPILGGQFLRWVPATFWHAARLDRLRPISSEWEPLPGLVPPKDRARDAVSFRHVPPPINRVQISTASESFLYDGNIAYPLRTGTDLWDPNRRWTFYSPSLKRFLALGPQSIEEITPDGQVLPFGTPRPKGDIAYNSFEDDPDLGATHFRADGVHHALWPDGTITQLVEEVVSKPDPTAPPAPLDIAPWPGVDVLSQPGNVLWLRILRSRERAPRCPRP